MFPQVFEAHFLEKTAFIGKITYQEPAYTIAGFCFRMLLSEVGLGGETRQINQLQ